jgi:hypothetical protein
MADELPSGFTDSSRLKQVNIELGHLANQHKSCRLNSGVFSGLGATILAISVVGLIHLLPAGADDWTQNPDSPIYSIALQDESFFMLKTIAVAIGFVSGLTFIFVARRQCSRQRQLWKREGLLRSEMRQLRDKLYSVDQTRTADDMHHKHHAAHETPLAPDEARGEYVGVYNPPSSRPTPSPESA